MNLSHQNALKSRGQMAMVMVMVKGEKPSEFNAPTKAATATATMEIGQQMSDGSKTGQRRAEAGVDGGRGHEHVGDMNYALSEMNCKKLYAAKRPIKAEIK